MKKLKRFSGLVGVVMMSIMMITACSNSKSADVDDKANKEEVANSANEKEEPVTIKFTYWGSPVEKKAVEDNLKKFEETYSHIVVDAEYIPNEDYLTKISAMVAGGDAPDVAYLFEANALAWAGDGELMNINDFLEKDPDLKREDFLDNIWYDWAPGKSLGTNTAVEAMGLYYNRQLFVEAGVSVPATAEDAWEWDEFIEVAQQMTIDANGNNALSSEFDATNISRYGVQFGTWWAPYMAMVFSNGGDYINEDGTEFTLDEPEAVEAIQRLADLINVYHVAPSPAQVVSMPSPVVGLQSEQVAMMIDGQWNLLDLGASGLDFGIGVLPKMKESVTLILGSPTVIFKSTEHPDESWLLFKWLANPESGLELHKGGLWMPLLKEWYEDPSLVAKWAENNPAHPKEYKSAMMDQTLNNGRPAPIYYTNGFVEMDEIVGAALDEVWLGKRTAEEVLTEISDLVEGKLKGRY